MEGNELRLIVTPNGLWGTEVTQGIGDPGRIPEGVPYTSMSVDQMESAINEIFETREPSERQFRMRTGPEGMRLFEEALQRELEAEVERLSSTPISVLPEPHNFDIERARELMRQTPIQLVNSAEPDRARGGRPTLHIMDEARSITTTQYYNALPRVEGESDVDYLDRLSNQEENN